MKRKSLNVKKRSLKNQLFFLNQSFIKKIYKIFEKNINGLDKALVAVSGGPDSLSLAFLTKCYSIKNSVKIYYVLVDHNLRKDHLWRLKKVAKLLKKLVLIVKF